MSRIQLDKVKYDAIFLGSTLQQTALAASLSRAGKDILLMDRNDYYGGCEASFRFRDFHQYFTRRIGIESPAFMRGSGYEFHSDDESTAGLPKDPNLRREAYEQILKSEGFDPSEYIIIDNDSTQIESLHPYGCAAAISGTGEAASISRTGSDGVYGVRMWLPPDDNPVAPATDPREDATTTQSDADTNAPPQPEPEPLPAPILTLASLNRMHSYFDLSLHPTLIFAKSPVVDAIVRTEMHHYFDFRAFDNTSLWLPNASSKKTTEHKSCLDAEALAEEISSGHAWTTPLNRSAIFKDNELSFEEKHKLMTLLHILVHDRRQAQTTEKHLEEYKKYAPRRLIELFEDLKTPPLLRALIFHAIVFQPYVMLSTTPHPDVTSITVAEASMRLRRYLASLGRFTPGAFLYPAYGISEVTQAFARFLSIYGGACVLRLSPTAIVLKRSTDSTQSLSMFGVITSASQLIRAPELRAELAELPSSIKASYASLMGDKHVLSTDTIAHRVQVSEDQGIDKLPHEDDRGSVASLEAIGGWQAVPRCGRVARAVLILDGPPFLGGKPIPTCTMVTIPVPQAKSERRVPVRVLVFDRTTCSAPQGRYVVHLSTLIDDQSAEINTTVTAEDVLLPVVLALSTPGPCLRSVGADEQKNSATTENETKSGASVFLDKVTTMTAEKLRAEAESRYQEKLRAWESSREAATNPETAPATDSKPSSETPRPPANEKISFKIPPPSTKPNVVYAVFFMQSFVYSPEGTVPTVMPSSQDDPLSSTQHVKGLLAVTDSPLSEVGIDASYAQAEIGFREYFPGLERFQLIKDARSNGAEAPQGDELWQRHMHQFDIHDKKLRAVRHTLQVQKQQIEKLRALITPRAEAAVALCVRLREAIQVAHAAVDAERARMLSQYPEIQDSTKPDEADKRTSESMTESTTAEQSDESPEKAARTEAEEALKQTALEQYTGVGFIQWETELAMRRIWRAAEALRSNRYILRDYEADYKAAAQNTLQPVVMLAARAAAGIGAVHEDDIAQIDAMDNGLIVVDAANNTVGMDALRAMYRTLCARRREIVKKVGGEVEQDSTEDENYMYDYFEGGNDDDELDAILSATPHVNADELDEEVLVSDEVKEDELEAVATQKADGHLSYANKALEELDSVLDNMGTLEELVELAKLYEETTPL